MTRLKRTLAVLLVLVLCSAGASAFIMPAMPVFDGSNFVEAITSNIHHATQIGHWVTHIRHIQKQAQQLKSLVAKYRSISADWRTFVAANTYETTGVWSQAANTGSGARVGWAQATQQVLGYIGGIASFPGSQQARRATDFATLELADGAGIAALETIGRVRLTGPGTDATIRNLDADVLADGDDMNTEAAQRQKMQALALLQAKQLNDNNKLLVALTEVQLVQLKAQRDAQAYAIETERAVRASARERMEEFSSGGSEAIRNWRLP